MAGPSKALFKGKDFKLKYPVEFGSELIESLSIRRPKAKDIKHLQTNSDGSFKLDDMLKLAANTCDQPHSVIDNLDAQDAMALIAEVSDFLSDGPGNWAEIIAILVYGHGMTPSEVMEFYDDDLVFWFDRLEWYNKQVDQWQKKHST